MTDVVYVTRDGENPELRYSLRSLVNIPHQTVWLFGGKPVWVSSQVVHQASRQGSSAYLSTRGHIETACRNPEVSDPFMLWNDDFFAMKPVQGLEIMNRGPSDLLIEKMGRARSPWMRGLKETHDFLMKRGFEDPLSYSLHVPLIIYKEEMLEAIGLAKTMSTRHVHTRTLYGNVANLGGVSMDDVKVHRREDKIPSGPWVSCSDVAFRSAMEPLLRYLFPDPSDYEKEGVK